MYNLYTYIIHYTKRARETEKFETTVISVSKNYFQFYCEKHRINIMPLKVKKN